MFAGLAREGEKVRLPSGRVGVIEGYAEGRPYGRYLDDGDEWQCREQLLQHLADGTGGALVSMMEIIK